MNHIFQTLQFCCHLACCDMTSLDKVVKYVSLFQESEVCLLLALNMMLSIPSELWIDR